MRHQLLRYCLDPQVAIPDVAGLNLSELERLAVQVHREPGNQPAHFESWFELDVFLPIARRGYRVIPQFEVGRYRIDLIVQGMDGSLAVECDGDAWHGADRYEEDAARQRDLERCGQPFWRVRESVFRLDPDKALSDLWETLKRHGILPKAEEEMRRGETRQAAKTHSVQDDPGDPFAADDSVGAQAQIGSDTPDGERDADQPSNQLRVKSGDSQPTDQTAGTEQSVPRFADPFGSPEQPPLHEGIVPHQPILPLSHHEPVPANASEVGALEIYTEWTPDRFRTRPANSETG